MVVDEGPTERVGSADPAPGSARDDEPEGADGDEPAVEGVDAVDDVDGAIDVVGIAVLEGVDTGGTVEVELDGADSAAAPDAGVVGDPVDIGNVTGFVVDDWGEGSSIMVGAWGGSVVRVVAPARRDGPACAQLASTTLPAVAPSASRAACRKPSRKASGARCDLLPT